MISSILPTYNRAPLSFEKGDGAWLIEADGTRYLDLGAGIAVTALGHAHPALVKALTDQAGALWHCSNLYQIPAQQKLADQLVEATFADTVFFTNSGTEAAELAIKMARKYWAAKGDPDRVEIIAFDGAFHGRSTAAIAATRSEKMTGGFGPLLPGFTHLPFGDHDALRSGDQRPHGGSDCRTGAGRRRDQGAAGCLPQRVTRSMRRNRRADDPGRGAMRHGPAPGRLFAHEWAGVTPDIMMVAKGLGGGFPIGALLATEDAAQGMVAGTHGSTYGGNPLGCAVASAVMDIVADEEFLAEVRRKSGLFRQKLEGLVAAHPDVFSAVRGSGLMLGLECVAPNTDIVAAGYAAHVITVPAAENVIRLPAPPSRSLTPSLPRPWTASTRLPQRLYLPMLHEYRFQRARRDDLAMLEHWLAEPHLAGWWGDPDREIVLIDEEIDGGPTDMRIVWTTGPNAAPFAFVQDYPVQAYGAPPIRRCAPTQRGRWTRFSAIRPISAKGTQRPTCANAPAN